MDDICDGCFGKTDNFVCFVQKYEDHSDCPCGNCIIKMVCSEVCQKRRDYFTGYEGEVILC